MNQLSVMPIRIRIASELRKAIYAGEYKSGDELSLTDVAAQLGEPIEQVFKTLVLRGDRGGLFVCVMPGCAGSRSR